MKPYNSGVSDVCSDPAQYLGREIQLSGYMLTQTYKTGRRLPRRRGEYEKEWIEREQAQISIYQRNYLVDLPYTLESHILVDEQPQTYYCPHPSLWDDWRKRLYWTSYRPLYKILRKKVSFTSSAILIDVMLWYSRLEACGIQPFWLGTNFTYKLPVTATGILQRSPAPEFAFVMRDIRKIAIHAREWRNSLTGMTRSYPPVELAFPE